jgi:hypothetical protein
MSVNSFRPQSFFSYQTFNSFRLLALSPIPSNPRDPFSKSFQVLPSESLDDFSGPPFRCKALSEILACYASTISILMSTSIVNNIVQPARMSAEAKRKTLSIDAAYMKKDAGV